MIDNSTELIWKSLHGETDQESQGQLEKELASDPECARRFEEMQALDISLKAAFVSDEEWLEGITNRIMDEMDAEEKTPQAFLQSPFVRIAACAALLLCGLFSVQLWVGSSDLTWEEPHIATLQYRGGSGEESEALKNHLIDWHTAFQASVNEMFAEERKSKEGDWTVALTLHLLEEGFQVEVKAERPQSRQAVRTWTFYAVDANELKGASVGWAKTVVHGIVATDP